VPSDVATKDHQNGEEPLDSVRRRAAARLRRVRAETQETRMTAKFIGYIGFNDTSEIHADQSRDLDRAHVEAAAIAQESAGFDRVLIPFGSSTPESQLVAAHAAAVTTKLGFLVAHRPGFTQPTLAARQLATLDRLSSGRVAVHIITGGADDEMARDGDVSTKNDRYARTDEYLAILRKEWTSPQPFDHAGRFYKVRQGFSQVKPRHLPVFFGGSSEEAVDVAGRHADIYAFWGESHAQVRELVARVRRSAARNGRHLGFSMSLRPVLGATEEAAWKRADAIVERVRELRESKGEATSDHAPPNVGSQRLLETAALGYRVDQRLWTGLAAIGGARGNSTGLVGTPEQVADALLEYYDLGVDHFLIRGFEPLKDAITYGRDLLPIVRERIRSRNERFIAEAV
jgi:alkanesulfonate monooxygenase